MEPQNNKKITLQKAISAHELAAASLADLNTDGSEPRYATMLARLQQNLAELQADAAATDPEELA